MDMLRMLAKGHADEARRLKKLETKSTYPAVVDQFRLSQKDFYEKYGSLTLVQWHRIERRRRRVLSPDKVAAIHWQRTAKVRKEARCIGLARGFFANKEYKWIENFCYETPNFDRVQELVSQNIYGGKDIRVVMQKFQEWVSSARDHITETHKTPTLNS